MADDDSDKAPPATPIFRFPDSETLPMWLGGAVAWAVTVAPAAFARGSSFGAVALAALDIGAAITGPALLASRPRLGRAVGISGFIALAVAVWLTTSVPIHPLRLDPIRGVFGAIAWGVFALSWSERRVAPPRPAPDAEASALQPRATLPRLAVPIAAVGVAATLVLLSLAWRVTDPDRALAAHAVAVGTSVAIISAAATIATARGRRRSGGARRFGAPAVRNLVLFAVVAVAGALFVALR